MSTNKQENQNNDFANTEFLKLVTKLGELELRYSVLESELSQLRLSKQTILAKIDLLNALAPQLRSLLSEADKSTQTHKDTK